MSGSDSLARSGLGKLLFGRMDAMLSSPSPAQADPTARSAAIEEAANVFKALGHEGRFLILCHLAQGPSKSDPATSDWRYSLMNWGHDPQKD